MGRKIFNDVSNEGNEFALSVVYLCVVRVRFVYGSCNGRLPDF